MTTQPGRTTNGRRTRPNRTTPRPPGPAARTAAQVVSSGAAHFTFTDAGEITITSYELARALLKAGGRAMIDKRGVKIGIYSGEPAAATLQAPDGPTQSNSMCTCDVGCPG